MDSKRRAAKRDNLDACASAVDRGRQIADHAPLILYLEVATVCNLRCTMCAVTWDPRRQPGSDRIGFMDAALLPKLDPILPRVTKCVLTGTGEPMLHPRFLDIVHHVKARGCWVGFNTNATRLDEPAARALLAAGVDHVTVSLDGASADVFEAIRHRARFDDVLDNARRFGRLRREPGAWRPYLGIEMVVMRDNVHELPAMVGLAAQLEADAVHFELLYAHDEDPRYRAFYDAHTIAGLPRGQVEAVVSATMAEARRLGIHLSGRLLPAAAVGPGDAPPARAVTAPARICTEPWTTLFVTWDGVVRTCCYSDVAIARLSELTVDEIWNGPRYREFREGFAAGRPPRSCDGCIRNGTPRHTMPEIAETLGWTPQPRSAARALRRAVTRVRASFDRRRS